MFLVFNKDKVCSYFIALSTVIFLFVMGAMMNNQTIQTVQPQDNMTYNLIKQENIADTQNDV